MTISREDFEARLKKEGTGPWMGMETFPRIVKILGKLIKDDDYSIKQIYLHALSAYTPEPSNLQTLAPTSEGKTYPIVNTTRVFPQADVLNLGGMSPTAIVHDVSTLVDKDTGEPLTEKLNALYTLSVGLSYKRRVGIGIAIPEIDTLEVGFYLYDPERGIRPYRGGYADVSD